MATLFVVIGTLCWAVVLVLAFTDTTYRRAYKEKITAQKRYYPIKYNWP